MSALVRIGLAGRGVRAATLVPMGVAQLDRIVTQALTAGASPMLPAAEHAAAAALA
ncbi:hypothetical protein GCM10027067_21760 [Pseudactinotalea suaedae]